MLEYMLRDPTLSLPAALAADGWRDTAVAVLIVPNRTAVAMVCSVKDSTGQAITFVQGGMEDHEAPQAAARREVREEIPSLARRSEREPFRVQWKNGLYIGSASIAYTRSSVPKRLHFLVLQASVWNLVPDLSECADAFWVRDPEVFQCMLDPTRQQNPCKYEAMCAAVVAAQQYGYLL